ncbi:PAS domain S-box protein [bacterium]|nr:PAS domain S-box protein [bacterium]
MFQDCQSILRDAPIGIFTSTVAGRFVAVNPAMAEMYGYDSPEQMIEEVTDIAVQTYADPADRLEFQQLLERHGEVNDLEGRLRRRDGLVFWATRSARAVRDESGTIVFYQGFTADISERKRADEAVRQSEARFRNLLENVENVAVQGYAMDGTTQYWNRASQLLYGYSAEEALGRSLLELIIPPAMRDEVAGAMHHMAQTGEPIAASEMTLMRNDGSSVHVFSSHAIVERSDGSKELFCIDIDLSDHKRAEQERERLQAQLFQAQKMESVGLLAGGVAHDFNNLLQIMGGNIHLLLKQMPADHPHANRLQTIGKNIDRATELVRQLLLFSRKAEAQKRSVDLRQEVKEAVRMLKRIIPRMIGIETSLAEDTWSISADPVQVEQVVLNLGSNSADAMPEGGRLLITTENVTVDPAAAADSVVEPGRYVLMRLSDTGVGMEPEVREQIFNPFFTTKTVGKGTGLGLASVYGIVKGHGGEIFCDSLPGQGTEFFIYWPVGDEVDDRHGELAAEMEGAPAHGSETILVVDDEVEIRELTTEILETFGYRVLTAASGEEALVIHADNAAAIDLVILDLSMPGMGGRNCLRELKQRDPQVQVLITSGYAAGDSSGGDIDGAAAGFIGKPYQLGELLAAVRTILGTRDEGAVHSSP